MNPYAILIALALAASAGFGAAWHWQDNRITQLELDHAQQQLTTEIDARDDADRQIAQVRTAQDNAAKRAADLAWVVADSRTELDRLRDILDATLQARSSTLEACTAHAATQSGLLNHCAGRLVDVSAKADGHVSDIRTLIESWPQ